jgi:glycosyltransferase involved in cell wall biosynthesis
VRIHLEYAHTLDPVQWQAQHAAGLVPDRFPYGLDWLEQHGFELYTSRPTNGVAALVDGVGRRATGGFEFVEAMRSHARRSCDAALCWDERAGVPAALRSSLPGEPDAVLGIIWLTDPDAPVGRRGRMLAKKALRRAAGVWAMSPAQLVVLERDWGVDPHRLHLLHMGIDVEFWKSTDEHREPELVVGAGNDRHRDHRLLVEAIARLRRRRPGVRLELVTHHAVDVPPELGRRHPHLTHSAMREMYGRASVVALALKPNLHVSGLSVLLESMACGCPVVITDSPGLSEYTRDAETSVFVTPHDADALADAIDALLSDPARAAAIGGAGRAVTERFSTQVQGRQLAAILQDALA